MAASVKYQDFMNLFIKCHPELLAKDQYSKGQTLWNELKTDKEALSKKYGELKVLEVKVRSRSVIRWAGYQHLPPKKKKHTVGKQKLLFS